ncbi:hypothetical protein [Streptomyces sp. 2A115]|uniref:hypothetical protein n=1 Tax=Streptomyces sp. 2A115 TaxID=3457439 RepID=UPI003FD4CEE6
MVGGEQAGFGGEVFDGAPGGQGLAGEEELAKVAATGEEALREDPVCRFGRRVIGFTSGTRFMRER